MLSERFAKTKLIAIILIALLSNSVLAQSFNLYAEDAKSGFTEKAIKNLAVGIESENAGVKKCCIYLAGFYEIRELINPLVKQFKKETDKNTKILIVLSLYKIGDKDGIKAVEQLVKNDNSTSLKNMNFTFMNELK